MPFTHSVKGRVVDLDDVLADIGDRYRAERKARGWSQVDFAEKSGLNLHTIKNLEAGRAKYLTVYVLAAQALKREFIYMMSAEWRVPESVPSLPPFYAKVLEAIVRAGVDKTLSEAGSLIGMKGNAMASAMSRIYVKLHVPYQMGVDRKREAVKKALKYGLIKEVPDGQTIG